MQTCMLKWELLRTGILFCFHWKSNILFLFPYRWPACCNLESWTPPFPTCGICNLKISCILVHISTHLLLPPPKVASIFLFFFLSQKILAKTLRSHREKMGLFIAVTHIFSWRAHLTEEKGQLLCGIRFKSDTGCIKQRAATVRQGCSL